MNKKITVIILAAVLAVVIALAVFIYPKLKDEVGKESSDTAEKVVADKAASFVVYDRDGNAVSLDDYIGKKPVVVNFWASWCPPCKEELPDFNDMYEKYKDEVEFFMVNLTDGGRETLEGAAGFVAENGYTFPVYYDTRADGATAYGINAIPVTLFIKSDGTLYHHQVGMLDGGTLKSYIEDILK